jgi:hypothetical protein
MYREKLIHHDNDEQDEGAALPADEESPLLQ